MKTFKRVADLENYMAGARVGLEVGATLDAYNVTSDLHRQKLKLLDKWGKIESEGIEAIKTFYRELPKRMAATGKDWQHAAEVDKWEGVQIEL